MENFKVALLQLMPGENQEENLAKGIAACHKARQLGAQLALFPEMWNIGYDFEPDTEKLKKAAVSAEGDFVQAFKNEARALDMAVGITFLESFEPSPRNSICLIDRRGNIVLKYAKVHTCDFADETALTAGEDFPVCVLDTGRGTVKIGAMICYDREFPESARLLMLGGAEIIIVPNACPMGINRISQLRARAYENMLGIATANYPKGKPDCNGHSTAFDGIAYREEETGERDTLIIEAGEREGIYIADFPIDEIREYRSREVHGNAYRRPGLYSALISEEKHEPFIR